MCVYQSDMPKACPYIVVKTLNVGTSLCDAEYAYKLAKEIFFEKWMGLFGGSCVIGVETSK